MPADVFISYAWSSQAHREYVRLLASHLHLLGYDVAIDAKLDYGSGLTGFMRNAIDAKHVLVVADESYVERAERVPGSGVAIENEWLRGAYDNRPANWLSVLFVNNPRFQLPAWLADRQPKGFDFHSDPEWDNFPGSEQIDDLWRWIEGLPADKSNATPIRVIKDRAVRLERIANLRDPAHWTTPHLNGEVHFEYGNQEQGTYTLGHDELTFAVEVSGHSDNSVYVLADKVKAVGLVPAGAVSPDDLPSFLRPGRYVTPKVGQTVVLMNEHGILCSLRITGVHREVNEVPFVPAHVTFDFEVHANK